MPAYKLADLKKENEELRNKLGDVEKSSRKAAKDIQNFQKGLGENLIVYQRFVGYLVAAILVLAGLSIIIYTAAKPMDDSKDHTDDIRDHGYTTGGIFIGVGLFKALIVYLWTGWVSRSSKGKVINAFMFEKSLFSGNQGF